VEVRASGDRLSSAELQQFLDLVSERSVAPNRCTLFSAHLMGSCPMGADPRTSAVRPTGELWTAENLYVADASVFPTAPGVNPMITIMSMARRTSRSVIERLKSRAS
jgi:choline dehydrogenase-like flavoprotein